MPLSIKRARGTLFPQEASSCEKPLSARQRVQRSPLVCCYDTINSCFNQDLRQRKPHIGGKGVVAMNGKTANFRVLPEGKGRRYQFFCALSGAHVCTTRPILSDTPEQALQMAWETEGKQYFNHCSKCGNWVIDAMYNVDVMECVDCAPYEGVPRYCKTCGARVEAENADTCSKCGALLTYKGTVR